MGKDCHLLFVCTGNTCRSIMAQKLFEKMWREYGKPGFQIQTASAGVAANPGDPISSQAEQLLQEEGIDNVEHRSCQVGREEVNRADLVMVMTEQHRHQLLQRFPAAGDKVWVMSEFAGWEGDIPDPFGMGLESYRRVADEIKLVLYRAIQQLNNKNGNDKAR